MSFRLKTIFGIAMIEMVLLSILVISGLHYLRTSNEQQLVQRGQTTVRLAATMTSDAVVALDLATLDVLVQQILKNPDVIYMRVRLATGIVLSQGGKNAALQAPFTPDETIADTDTDGILDVDYPIRIAGKTLGRVELGLDTSTLATTMTGAKHWMMSVAALEIILVALFGFGLGTLLTRQLSALQASARRVADGEFGHTLKVRGNDELACTAISFNQMSQALSRFAQDLERARQHAEEKQALAESILADAINSASDGVAIIDAQGILKHINQAFFALLPLSNTAGKITTLQAAANDDDVLNEIKMLATSGPDAPGQASHWTTKQSDGRYILNSRTPLHSGGWAFVRTDVTPIYTAQERERKLEWELLQAHKLEALGTLAGGIAHEINTPIHYIGDNLRFFSKAADTLLEIITEQNKLLDQIETVGLLPEEAARCHRLQDDGDLDFLSEEIPEATQQSLDGIERVASIVLAMKEFSHPASKVKAPVDINRIIERASIVCRNEWKHVAELKLELDPDLPTIQANEGELNQVVLNLIVNAAQAITEISQKSDHMGTITVRTRNNGGSIRVEVEDTGPGVPESLRDRIFEPFFTTKAVGKGTGQGLSLCQDMIVSKHGGKLWFMDTDPHGATFVFTVPTTGEDQKEKEQACQNTAKSKYCSSMMTHTC